MKSKLIIAIFISVLIVSCVDRQSLNDFSESVGTPKRLSDTSYIQLNPVWTGFKNPQDILVGREPFIYVADTDNNRIVMLNLSGTVIGTKTIPHPVALAQDYRLNLLVCGQDTLPDKRVINVLYKIDLYAGQHDIEKSPMKRVFPADSSQMYRADKRILTGVAVLFDNSYFVTRTGPDNTSIYRPDNGIMKFIQVKNPSTGVIQDSLIGDEPNFSPNGTGLMSINQLSRITAFNKKNTEIITTQVGNTNFKVQWLRFISNSDYTGYENKFDPSRTKNDLYTPGRFLRPEDITVDNNGIIYVIDSEKDSLFRFTADGKEQFSFGGESVFKTPKGVAFFDRTLYVCDSGNNRILRFVLSTDFN